VLGRPPRGNGWYSFIHLFIHSVFCLNDRSVAASKARTSQSAISCSLFQFTVSPRFLKAGLRNLWHAWPQWHAEIFSWHAAFPSVPFFLNFFCPTSFSILWRMCMCVLYTARPRRNVPDFGRVFLMLKVYRYNPKHLCPKLNGYGDKGSRKVWSSCGSAYCTWFAWRNTHTLRIVRPCLQPAEARSSLRLHM